MPEWLFTFGFCFVIAVTSACAQVGGKNYFPLADSTRWEYAGRFSSASGREYSVRMTSKVDGETLINGKKYFKLVTASDFSDVPGISRRIEDVRYYRFAEDGIYFHPGNDPNKPDLLEMPLPIPIGVKWLSGATEVQAERVGTIQIRGHEYEDCLKITFKLADGSRTTTNYYAPGVGIIKTMYVNITEPKSVVEVTLEKYEP
jgi:hypothetical protein